MSRQNRAPEVEDGNGGGSRWSAGAGPTRAQRIEHTPHERQDHGGPPLRWPAWLAYVDRFPADDDSGVAIWAMYRERAKRGTSTDYFLAGRDAGWFLVGGSLFASNIGSERLVGLAGTGAASAVAVAQFEILASLILLILGWVFVPFYLSSRVFTMPEFLERRYSESARWYLAVVSIIGYVLTKISVTIAAGGIVFEPLMGSDFWTGALIVVVITGIYTIFGGLRAVLYTDLLQMFVLIGGAAAVTVLGLSALGGWGELRQPVAPGFLNLWKPLSDPDFPWTGIAFGAPILGVWTGCYSTSPTWTSCTSPSSSSSCASPSWWR